MINVFCKTTNQIVLDQSMSCDPPMNSIEFTWVIYKSDIKPFFCRTVAGNSILNWRGFQQITTFVNDCFFMVEQTQRNNQSLVRERRKVEFSQ